jgi:hypothetical protein
MGWATTFERCTHLMLVKPDVRQALLDRHKWVFHETSYERMWKIKITQLQVSDPGMVDTDMLSLIDQTLGRDARCVVFLKPTGSPVTGSSPGDQVRLAICRDDVPNRVGVDWSSLATFLEVKRIPDSMQTKDAFVKVVEKAGSFLSYDPVASSLLRICPPHRCAGRHTYRTVLLGKLSVAASDQRGASPILQVLWTKHRD